MRVLVTGATGFVGQVVVNKLLAAGDEVYILTRNVGKAAMVLGSSCRYFQWDELGNPPPAAAYDGVEGIINLMGESISSRWDDQQKKKIYHSRIDGTKKLIEGIEQMSVKPKVFISASAVGIYGNRGAENINESSTLADDFLAKVCKDWENEANKARNHGARVVIIRTGVVLGKGGGALEKMLPPFKMGLGGPIGSGQQFMSWIHVEDLAAMYIEALKNPAIKGPMNGAAPYPATNAEFSKALGKVLRRPAFMPVPEFAVKLMFGEMAQIILEGQKVLPVKFKEANFRFRYPTLEMTLKETAY